MNERAVLFLVRNYLFIHKWFERVLGGARGCFVGLWLGIFSRRTLNAINKEYYTRTNRPLYTQRVNDPDYHSNEWNLGGLFSWEERALNRYFRGCKRLLLIGAGGGREVLALRRLGYHVDAFEPHPDLVFVANRLLRAEGYEPSVQLVSRDEGPTNLGKEYDGIIIGWAAYAYVQERKRRIALLQELRGNTREQCPILLSFFHRDDAARSYKIASFVANVVRRSLRRGPAEIGDWLRPEYIHCFTQADISDELTAGGFKIVFYGSDEYGHAVGTAV